MTATRFQVVVDTHGRHALWPAARSVPNGWQQVRTAGSREECLTYVEQHWKGLSLRREQGPSPRRAKLDFSLMFFGSDEGVAAREKYEMVIAAARYADANDFTAVWVPERHFTRMGSLYPNPAVLHAALARETKRIQLRAGSVVLPLHSPLRIAEEWAVVDNLSGGRVEVSFAPGWNPGDFVLAPTAYTSRYDILYEGLDKVRRLWAGESMELTDGAGQQIRVRVYPTPVQKNLAMWVTAAGSERSFEQAGRAGVHLLTHLFDQDADGLAKKVQLYRQARATAGHDPDTGRVAVALHTYIGETMEEVREQVRGPYAEYLRANSELLQKLAQSRGVQLDLSRLPGEELIQAVEWMFDKFLGQRSLMGTVDGCADLVAKLTESGVQEICCLVDFGPSPSAILESLPRLKTLRDRFAQ